MSVITNVMLCTLAGTTHREKETLRQINRWLKSRGHGSLKAISSFAGGNRAMERTVYAAAYTHFDDKEFVKFIRCLKPPKHWQLFISSHEEPKFTDRLQNRTKGGR